MRRKIALMTTALATMTAAGCANFQEDTLRIDGVTPWVGDSLASDTVLQMVDPWQPGVEDTHLVVPAQRGPAQSPADAAADSKSTQSDNP
jgi:hypothetical protein